MNQPIAEKQQSVVGWIFVGIFTFKAHHTIYIVKFIYFGFFCHQFAGKSTIRN